jgi:ankyrin repeat protein
MDLFARADRLFACIDRHGDDNALCEACDLGNIEDVRALIDGGAYVDDFDYLDRTPLMYACMKGHTEIADLLIKHGADPNALNADGDTVLIRIASLKDKADSVRHLLESGANMLARNNGGETAIYKASGNGCLDTVHVLTEAYAKPLCARLIQRRWRDANANPNYLVCRRRLQREYVSLST